MPLKISSSPKKVVKSKSIDLATTAEDLLTDPARSITKNEIKELIRSYRSKTYKVAAGVVRPYDPHFDTHSIWFSLREVRDFFTANGVDINTTSPDNFGMRIYLGFHDPTVNTYHPTNSGYDWRDTVILIATQLNALGSHENLLTDNHSVSIASGAGDGLDNGKLCPPDSCPSQDIEI